MPAIQTELLAHIAERTTIIKLMNAQHINLDFLSEFSIPELTACCDRIAANLPDIRITDQAIQRELIQNEPFAAYLASCLALLPDETENSEEPTDQTSGDEDALPSAPVIDRTLFMTLLSALVQVCQDAKRDITVYSESTLIGTLSLGIHSAEMRLVFLEYFAPMNLDAPSKQAVIDNLNHCNKIPLELDSRQKELLLEPCVISRYLFDVDSFQEICSLLDSCPGLLDIIRLLHQRQVKEYLELAEYKVLAQDAPGCYQLLQSITDQMDKTALERFFMFWQRGGCAVHELRYLERWITAHPGQDWDNLFATYSGYINLLYGVRFKEIDLSAVSGVREDLLIYAIVNNKKHFIRVVDEHAEEFFAVPGNSILFLPELYKKHFNLNELTAQNLDECARMLQRKFRLECLAPDRCYTLPELKALYDAPERYILFYHALASDSQDYRLMVFRQIRKRNMLPAGMEEQDIVVLAQYLSCKPLHSWLQEDFGHIRNLTADDVLKLLIHLEQMQHLIFSMAERNDVLLALQNLDVLAQFNSIDELKANIVRIDQDWHSLSSAMGLNSEFLYLYQENIVDFVCKNGANIAERYRTSLNDSQQTSFLRVVKAELMGQLSELKYFEGDLQREIDFSLTRSVEISWKRNLKIERNGVQAGEYDDFFSTMLLGVQPYSTCLAYNGGAYCECLLSSFDSNKKILYATQGGRIVGRAFLRLTKGRLTGGNSSDGRFTFVDLEDVKSSRQESAAGHETLTLFLERPYTSHAGPELKTQVVQAFVALAQRKAAEMGTVLVLSLDYRDDCGASFARTQFDIYISKSKAGMQYLDSLDGQATVSTEGNYKANTFLVQSTPKIK